MIALNSWLTTIPSRLKNLEIILDSLLNQTKKIDKIILNIPKYSIRFKSNYVIPEFLKKDKFKDILVINRCKDYGPGTKLLGGLTYLSNKNGYVIILDDDRTIKNNFFSS